MVRGPGCELCEAARLTTWYHEDEVCWVADCEVCGVPMVVWRRHAVDPPPEELDHMLAQLAKVADSVLGPSRWSTDSVMRQIPDHFHAHARDPNWWQRRLGAVTARAAGGSAGSAGGAGSAGNAGRAGRAGRAGGASHPVPTP